MVASNTRDIARFQKWALECYIDGYTHMYLKEHDDIEKLIDDGNNLMELFRAFIEPEDADTLFEKFGLTVARIGFLSIEEEQLSGDGFPVIRHQLCFMVRPGSDFDVLDAVFHIQPFCIKLE